MKQLRYLILVISLLLVGCTNPTQKPIATPLPSRLAPSTSKPRITMVPTWTPSPPRTAAASRTPRNTSTPLVMPRALLGLSSGFTNALLIDRPTFAQLAKPTDLVTLQYDPASWSLATSYPTLFMGYSLSNSKLYGCKVEPTVGAGEEGYETEQYSRPIGATKFTITRFSQAGILSFANYCTGEAENRTCYKVTPGNDHPGCVQASEEVLASYNLIANPFLESTAKSPNRWTCQDAAGTIGLCQVSYSIPLNTLAFTPDGQAWAAGDDGILLHREGQAWKEVSSPATHPLYDMDFSSISNGWAVGAGAAVLHWDGSQWSEVLPYHGPGEGPGGSTQVLYGVEAVSANEAWMVGAMKGLDQKTSPYVLHWNGKELVEEGDLPGCNCGLNAVLARGRNDIYAAGGSDMGVILFHWDGVTWTNTQLPGADHLYSISQASDGSLWVGGIEVARDQSDTRGALFRWDGSQWLRVAVPPLTGGIYSLNVLSTGQIVLGGEFTALFTGMEWQPISTDIAGYGWIVDIEQDPQGAVWALTRSGNIFKLVVNR